MSCEQVGKKVAEALRLYMEADERLKQWECRNLRAGVAVEREWVRLAEGRKRAEYDYQEAQAAYHEARRWHTA